jgi:hypothetical protein
MPTRHPQDLSDRQRLWLDHLVAWGKSGRRLSEYASDHNLDLQQLYNWKTLLRGRGFLPGEPSTKVRPRRSVHDRGPGTDSEKSPVRFTAVHVTGNEPPSPLLRVRFPNGIVLETTSADSSTPVRDLLSFLAGLP